MDNYLLSKLQLRLKIIKSIPRKYGYQNHAKKVRIDYRIETEYFRKIPLLDIWREDGRSNRYFENSWVNYYTDTEAQQEIISFFGECGITMTEYEFISTYTPEFVPHDIKKIVKYLGIGKEETSVDITHYFELNKSYEQLSRIEEQFEAELVDQLFEATRSFYLHAKENSCVKKMITQFSKEYYSGPENVAGKVKLNHIYVFSYGIGFLMNYIFDDFVYVISFKDYGLKDLPSLGECIAVGFIVAENVFSEKLRFGRGGNAKDFIRIKLEYSDSKKAKTDDALSYDSVHFMLNRPTEEKTKQTEQVLLDW